MNLLSGCSGVHHRSPRGRIHSIRHAFSTKDSNQHTSKVTVKPTTEERDLLVLYQHLVSLRFVCFVMMTLNALPGARPRERDARGRRRCPYAEAAALPLAAAAAASTTR